jgi:hypothetical protein
MISKNHIDVWFKYHAPEAGDTEKYEKIRGKAKEFAELILELVPGCADQSDAIRKLREVVMTANAGIACKGV